MKLFTRGDLDRCARLAVLNYVDTPDPEYAIMRAVGDIAADAPMYYDEETVKRILRYALPDASEAAIIQTLEASLEYLRQ